MRIRFWATIRRPAFSITALTAPVRLRAVASGLMIEKVRSMAMILSLKRKRWFGVAGLISAPSRYGKRPPDRLAGASPQARGPNANMDYDDFTEMNPI